MKRIFVIILIPLLTLTLFAKIDLKFEKDSIDFGVINAGKVVDVEFKFVNAGDEELVITSVNAACGCTTTQLEKMNYKPGEKGMIPVKFDSKGIEGQVIKTITVNTNNKENPYNRLEIKGTINLTQFAVMELAPGADKIDFKTVKFGNTYTERIKIKNSGTINLLFREIVTFPEIYMLFPRKEMRPGEEMEVKLVFTPMQRGPFTQFVRINSDAYRQRMVIIKVTANVE